MRGDWEWDGLVKKDGKDLEDGKDKKDAAAGHPVL